MKNENTVIVAIVIATVIILGSLIFIGNRSADSSSSASSAAEEVQNFSEDLEIGDIYNEGDYMSGNIDAKVAIVEFSDFECPYCILAHPEIKNLRDRFSEDDLLIVFRHIPLVEIHEQAYPAAIAAQAATNQGKFSEFADALFANSANLSESFYLELAQDLGLNIDQFNVDRESEETKWQAYRARDFIDKIGFDLVTPTIFLNNREYQGERTTDAMAEAIELELAQE